MKVFAVEIQVTIRKTYKVEAEHPQEAQEVASGMFSVLNEKDVDEYYNEEVMSVEEVK